MEGEQARRPPGAEADKEAGGPEEDGPRRGPRDQAPPIQ